MRAVRSRSSPQVTAADERSSAACTIAIASSLLFLNTCSGYESSTPGNHSANGIVRCARARSGRLEASTSKKSQIASQNASSSVVDHSHSSA